MSAQSLAQALLLLVPEPITESERDRRVEEIRADEFTLKEAAQFLAETEDEDVGSWETQLKTAIEAGHLKAAGKGRDLRISYGALCDWRGESVPLIPEWGFDVEVLPDDQVEEVEQRRRHRESARRVLERSPTLLASFAPLPDELPEGVNGANNVAIGLASLLRLELPLHWRDIRALEMVIEEVRDRLGGEDPADEILRSALNDAKTAVQEVVEGLAGMRDRGGAAGAGGRRPGAAAGADGACHRS
jgi:hypothetical protein